MKLETFENMDDKLRDFHFDINIKGTWKNKLVPAPYRAATIVMIIYFFIFRLILLLIFIPVILKLSV